jgi:hypothetical protein
VRDKHNRGERHSGGGTCAKIRFHVRILRA